MNPFIPDKNLADFYITRLSSIAAETVVLDVKQVNSVIGVEACEELSQFIVTVKTDLLGGKKKKRSAVPPHKRFAINGLARFNRLQFIAAVRAAITPQPNPFLNPTTLPPEKYDAVQAE